MFKCLILVIRSTLEKNEQKNELKLNQRRPRNHHTQQASDILIFFCDNGDIKWLFSVQQCALEFKSFPTSPRKPNLESGRESYNLGKFNARKKQSAYMNSACRDIELYATTLKQRRN